MKVLLVINNGKPDAVQAAGELGDWLDAKGVGFSSIDAEDIIADGRFSEEAMDRVNEGYDYIFTFGGDGTMLSAAQMAFRRPAPVLGINFGTLGFLTGATAEGMLDAVQATLDGKLTGQVRSALDVTIEDDKGKDARYTVLNEISLTRGSTEGIVDYQVLIDGEKLANIRADGIIIASSTGSTAYSLSAGGPLLSPGVRCMIVSALAPHSLLSRAMVTGRNETVQVIPDEEGSIYCFAFIDGKRVLPNKHIVRVTSNVHTEAITLLRYDMPGFISRASSAFYRE